jgi:formamidopyrimidine-DNA glycosylase
MPELPDVTVYVEAIAARTAGDPLLGVRLGSPFLLRTVEPPLAAATGRTVVGVHRLGKRIVLDLVGDLHLAIHLMIAGRLHWRPVGARLQRKLGLAAFDFPGGTLVLTEAGSKRRAALHVVHGAAGLRALDRGGIEVLDASTDDFAAVLNRESHTLKRALTDPRLFSGNCARCQTGGRLLADRALSRLLKSDWPRTLDEIEDSRA